MSFFYGQDPKRTNIANEHFVFYFVALKLDKLDEI